MARPKAARWTGLTPACPYLAVCSRHDSSSTIFGPLRCRLIEQATREKLRMMGIIHSESSSTICFLKSASAPSIFQSRDEKNESDCMTDCYNIYVSHLIEQEGRDSRKCRDGVMNAQKMKRGILQRVFVQQQHSENDLWKLLSFLCHSCNTL